MNPEKEHKKGGSRLQKSTEKPEKQKKPRVPLTSRQKALRVVYIVVTVIAAIIVTAFAASRLLFVKPNVPTTQNRPKPPVASGEPISSDAPEINDSGRKEDFFTFLIIGRDTGGGGNTDTVMLVAYDVPNQKLSVMNIPRDTMVNVSWDIKRINSVYNVYGGGDEGIQALFDEVSQLVGFIPDFSVVVEWEAVGEMAEAIGGVDFEVPVNMNYDDPTQDLHIHISKGMQHLDGEGVMKVLRFRDGNNNTGYVNGDIGRIETQQKLLKAIVEKLLTKVREPSTILNLAGVFTENVTTDLTVQNIFWFGQQAVLGKPPLSIDNVNFVTMPCTNKSVWSRSFAGKSYQFQSYVVPNTEELVSVVNEYFNPYLEDLDDKDLDIMYVNSDGTIGSSTGVLEDTRHNSAWAAYKSTPKETPTPEVSETPELPESTETPAPGVTPDPGATSAPPGGGGGETTAPTATPSAGLEGPTDDEPAAPEPTPTPDSGAESGPPEGIPII